MKAPEGLLKLLRQQYTEASDDLDRRAAKWLRLYRAWRGLFSEQDEETERTGETTTTLLDEFYFDEGATYLGTDTTQTLDYPRIYIRETFRHCEVYMSRIDEAFTAPVKPFELVLPRVWAGRPPTPEEFQQRRASLYGASELLVRDYKAEGNREEQLRALRDAVVFGTGFTYQRKAPGSSPYPRALIERFPPWMVLPDPFCNEIQKSKFLILKRRFTQQEACDLWPDAKEEIRQSAMTASGQDNPEGLGDRATTAQRLEVLVLEYWTRCDPQALEGLLDDDDLQDAGDERLMRILVLSSEEGPSETVLEAYPNPHRHGEIPVQEYALLRSPTEQGCHGIGVADWIEEDQVLMNSLFNLMLLNLAYSTLQGGFYDALHAENLEEQIQAGFRPGQWRALNIGGKNPKDIMYPIADMYRNVSPQFQTILEELRKNAARTTGVTDMNAGLSTKTNTDTLGEVNALRSEGNQKFRFYISRLDPQVTRALVLYSNTFADALQAEQAAGRAGVLWYLDEKDTFWPVAPEFFDQPWEIKLNAGASWVSDEAKAQNLMLLAKVAMESGEPVTSRAAIRKVALMKGVDPDDLLSAQAQMPMGMPGMPGQPAGMPALPGPVQAPPGLPGTMPAMPGGPAGPPMPPTAIPSGGSPWTG